MGFFFWCVGSPPPRSREDYFEDLIIFSVHSLPCGVLVSVLVCVCAALFRALRWCFCRGEGGSFPCPSVFWCPAKRFEAGVVRTPVLHALGSHWAGALRTRDTCVLSTWCAVGLGLGSQTNLCCLPFFVWSRLHVRQGLERHCAREGGVVVIDYGRVCWSKWRSVQLAHLPVTSARRRGKWQGIN